MDKATERSVVDPNESIESIEEQRGPFFELDPAEMNMAQNGMEMPLPPLLNPIVPQAERQKGNVVNSDGTCLVVGGEIENKTTKMEASRQKQSREVIRLKSTNKPGLGEESAVQDGSRNRKHSCAYIAEKHQDLMQNIQDVLDNCRL